MFLQNLNDSSPPDNLNCIACIQMPRTFVACRAQQHLQIVLYRAYHKAYLALLTTIVKESEPMQQVEMLCQIQHADMLRGRHLGVMLLASDTSHDHCVADANAQHSTAAVLPYNPYNCTHPLGHHCTNIAAGCRI